MKQPWAPTETGRRGDWRRLWGAMGWVGTQTPGGERPGLPTVATSWPRAVWRRTPTANGTRTWPRGHAFARLLALLRGVFREWLDLFGLVEGCGTAASPPRFRAAPEQVYLPGFRPA